MRAHLSVIVGAGLLAGCAAPQTLPRFEVDVDGVARSYHLFDPIDAGGPMPLLVAVHGGGGRGVEFPQQPELEALAEEQGFLIAFPQSKHLPENEGEWQLNTGPESRHDLDYIDAMIADIASRHDVDTTRVYATGYSLGSMFTYELACHSSTRFAAIALHAGTMPVAPRSCAPEDPVAIMHIHGARDSIIAYVETWEWKNWDSVGTMWDVPGLVRFWADQHGCATESRSDSSSSQHTMHEGCEDGVRVEHHRLADGGHEWPDAIDGVPTSTVIWSFLRQFAKR